MNWKNGFATNRPNLIPFMPENPHPTHPTLLILAAGMGSRYGGLKQIDPMGSEGETLLEYSVYDAIQSGFGRIVFIIREDFAADFKAKVTDRFADQIRVDCVFQDMQDLPGDLKAPADRSKPWGTGHAVLAARNAIREPFAVINADDFYGRRTFEVLAEMMRSWSGDSASDGPIRAGMAAFPLSQTLSAHGKVSRGICQANEDGKLVSIVEQSAIRASAEGPIVAEGPEAGRIFSPHQLVSMNAFAFEPAFFPELEKDFHTFLEQRIDEENAEFFLPTACTQMLTDGRLTMDVRTSNATWLGMTYAADAEGVRSALKMFINQGIYPPGLWQCPNPDKHGEG